MLAEWLPTLQGPTPVTPGARMDGDASAFEEELLIYLRDSEASQKMDNGHKLTAGAGPGPSDPQCSFSLGYEARTSVEFEIW